MAEDRKEAQKDFRAFFQGTPCADMMKKMMAGKKEGQTFDCAEMMAKMMEKIGKTCGHEERPDQSKKESSSAEP